MTWLILGTSIPDAGRRQRWIAAAGQGLFVRRFLNHFDLGSVREVLPAVAGERLRDPHLTAAEAARVRRLVTQPDELQRPADG